jgi:adenosyl cobinamide kinase/adenosyl cobinamide phosphate guanylyltransferase
MPLTVLIGGARSGKSSAAVRLAAATDAPVTFIATAEARDAEMTARIARHRAERPRHWNTVEAPIGVADALATIPDGDTAIVDCLTLWVSNLLGAEWSDDLVVGAADALTAFAVARSGTTIVVTNEVGSGLVPIEPLSRRYRDLLGTMNAIVAGPAAHVHLMVAGRAVSLHPLATDE